MDWLLQQFDSPITARDGERYNVYVYGRPGAGATPARQPALKAGAPIGAARATRATTTRSWSAGFQPAVVTA